MKIVIVSDIRGKAESIIPYGLKLARYLESEVDIIHVVDPRTEPVLPSSYADSQTFALDGNKFNYEDTMHREKRNASLALDQLLSKEASKLNYPLKIKSIIEEDTIENKLREYAENESGSLVLINSQPDGHMFKTHQDMIDTIKDAGAMCIFVPPGHLFSEFKSVTIPCDLTNHDLDKYRQASFFLQHFNPLINAIDLDKNPHNTDFEEKARQWQELATEIFVPSVISISILIGNEYAETLISHINGIDTDLIFFLPKEQNFLANLFYKSMERQLLDTMKAPFLYYS